MSITAKPAGASLAPELAILAGSRPGISPALTQVMLPPGCTSVRGAVLGAEVTLVRPPAGAWRTEFEPLEATAELLRVVTVDFLMLVVVAPVTWPAAVVVVSPAAVVVVLSSVPRALVDVVSPEAVVFFLS